MHPKDPVYLLTEAVERVKDTIPDQDAKDWLKDAIAAARVEWAYIIWKENKGLSFQSFITIPPSAAIIEGPDLKIDWPKGTATVKRRRGVVECPVVVSRRDLDRNLANITTSSEATDCQPDREQDRLSRREQQKAETKAKYKRWHKTALEIKRERKDDKRLTQIELAKLIAKKEKDATGIEVNPETIKRRLNKYHSGWAD